MAKISRCYNKLLAVLLSILGFSCVKCSTVCEYGTPSATYKAKGAVISAKDNTPIEGIQTVLKANWDGSNNFIGLDTVYSDKNGMFNLNSRELGTFSKFQLELNDIDGELNGSFVNKEIEVDYSNEKFKGGDGNWNKGTIEKDLGMIKMEMILKTL